MDEVTQLQNVFAYLDRRVELIGRVAALSLALCVVAIVVAVLS